MQNWWSNLVFGVSSWILCEGQRSLEVNRDEKSEKPCKHKLKYYNLKTWISSLPGYTVRCIQDDMLVLIFDLYRK